MRVYQIAEEVKLSNRSLVQMLQDRGVDISSHMARVAADEEELLRSLVAEIRKERGVTEPEAVVEAAAPVEPSPVEAPPVEPPEPAPPVPAVEKPAEPRVSKAPPIPAHEPPAEPKPAEEEEVEKPEPVKDHSETIDAPAKPAGRRVKRLQEREAIEQSLVEMDEEAPPSGPDTRRSRKKDRDKDKDRDRDREESPARAGPNRTQTYKFHKRGAPRTLRRKSRGGAEIERPTGPVDITLPISVKDFSQKIGFPVKDILRVLMQNGVMANINATLDQDTVDLLALEFEREVNVKVEVEAEEAFLTDIEEVEDRPEDMEPRAPVVAMLGHVDHGKTSLLDYIRRANVAAKEAGGITQHISSYRVPREDGPDIVFIDLPGHEAFTEMRGRGAQTTDIVILVVAAEEGVMPQTEESINHAKAAEVPVIVALNKSDKPEANPQRVKEQLTRYELIPEEWGGEVLMVETSATTGDGIDDLLEAIGLQAEMLELKANAHKKAIGTVLEAEKSEGRGVIATVLVQEGTLRPGDVVLAGTGFGRIRDVRNDRGETIALAGPSMPVEITGLSQVPEAGDRFYAVENLARAKTIAEERAWKKREESLAEKQTVSLTDLFRQAGQAATSEVPVIVKADTKGSVEAIARKLASLENAEVKIKILHSAVGSVNESDVQLASASASQAIIFAFNVIAEERARALAHERGVKIGYYQIIYELIDEVKHAMEARLAPEEREVMLGHAIVRDVFRSSRLGPIAGCQVQDGIIRRNARARVRRGEKVIHDSSFIESLKRFKDDAKEVREGFECGIRVRGYDDPQQDDIVEAYEIQEFKRTLDDVAAAADD
jgi:translation initiation factor IF-2